MRFFTSKEQWLEAVANDKEMLKAGNKTFNEVITIPTGQYLQKVKNQLWEGTGHD